MASHFGVEHPFATYFHVHQGYRLLTHSHMGPDKCVAHEQLLTLATQSARCETQSARCKSWNKIRTAKHAGRCSTLDALNTGQVHLLISGQRSPQVLRSMELLRGEVGICLYRSPAKLGSSIPSRRAVPFPNKIRQKLLSP